MKSIKSLSIRSFLPAVSILLFLCTVPTWAGGAEEASWSHWRGPNRDGISAETDWDPEALAGGPRLLWSKIIGMGYSNVAIAAGRLYTMARNKDGECVLCLNADTGEEIWRYKTGERKLPQPTPAIDGKHLYALTYDAVLVCLKRERGRLVWSRNLIKEFDARKPDYGYGTSPVVEGDLVLVNMNDTGIALNKLTGKVVWEGKLCDISKRQPHSYATPVFHDHDGRRLTLIFSRTGLFDDKVFISSSEMDFRSAVLDISGDEPELVWENHDMANHFSSCVYIDGYLYGVDGDYHYSIKKCTLRCVDAKTGELMWEVPTGGASLTAADGKLIVLTTKGTLHIAEATPTAYVEISSCQLPKETMIHWWWTPPVLCGGKIYCRNYIGDLLCIDVCR